MGKKKGKKGNDDWDDEFAMPSEDGAEAAAEPAVSEYASELGVCVGSGQGLLCCSGLGQPRRSLVVERARTGFTARSTRVRRG